MIYILLAGLIGGLLRLAIDMAMPPKKRTRTKTRTTKTRRRT